MAQEVVQIKNLTKLVILSLIMIKSTLLDIVIIILMGCQYLYLSTCPLSLPLAE